jgi:TolA-binding protein
MRQGGRRTAVGILALAMGASLMVEARQSPEELAQRQYKAGVDFLNAQKYDEALRDFQRVIDAYPSSSVADDALLQVARFHLQVSRNLDAAATAVDMLQNKYATSDSLPFSYVISGHVALARGRQTADLDRALAEFERVPRFFPGTDAVPEAVLARADTLRLGGRCAEAVEQYAQVIVEYPRSVWAPRANVNASRCLVAQGRTQEAMAGLQLAARNPMAGESAARARALNTVLYRLYIRAPQPPYVFSSITYGGATGRLRDIRALAVAGTQLFAVANSAASVLDVDAKGAVVRTAKVENARGVFIDADGRATFFSSAGLVRDQERALTLSVPKPDKSPRLLEDITAIAALSTGELIVADSNGQAMHRFGRDLRVIGTVGKGRVDRYATGSLDQIAALDKDAKTVTVMTQDGKPAASLQPRGQGWQFDEPVDVAFDAFDHLYVLDRGLGTVFIFTMAPAPRLVSSFSIPEKAPGAFRRPTAFALDAEGRLYIYDDRAERIQVYR